MGDIILMIFIIVSILFYAFASFIKYKKEEKRLQEWEAEKYLLMVAYYQAQDEKNHKIKSYLKEF